MTGPPSKRGHRGTWYWTGHPPGWQWVPDPPAAPPGPVPASAKVAATGSAAVSLVGMGCGLIVVVFSVIALIAIISTMFT